MSADTTSRWSASDYARHAGFVPALGAPVLALLDPQPGETILDLGCGDGVLTAQIAAAGAKVIGVDASEEMIAAAAARGLDARVGDGQALDFDGAFDAVFSNAALHWMTDPGAVAAGVYRALRAGGRFIGELGGAGNVAILRNGIRDELIAQGHSLPAEDPQYYPSVEAFTRLYEQAGFANIDANLIPRETELPDGVSAWVKTFRAGWLDVAQVPDERRAAVAAAIERRLAPKLRRPDGSWFADYVRLRFTMVKPA
ncbi:MAG: class SAM-dependent methyltransferase [Alphaproteobacteria bacterium]|nr:class SAM-dependent methyltransferase [Alphaproteobacteria bacterium]